MRASPASRRSRAKTRIRARKHPFPACTYAHPQVASVGLTEADAKAAGFELKIGRFPLSANGKAIALGEPEGLVKTIFDAKSGRLLGAHIIGAEATELIQGFVDRDEFGNDGRRADAQRLPAPDALRGDARERAGKPMAARSIFKRVPPQGISGRSLIAKKRRYSQLSSCGVLESGKDFSTRASGLPLQV